MGLQKKRHLKASGADSKTTFSPPILAWLNLWFNFKNGEHMWKHASNYFSQSSTPYVNQGHRYTWLSHGTDKLSYCLRHQLWARGLQSEMAHRGRESTVLTWVCASCFYEDLILCRDIAILHTSQSPDPRTPHQWSLGPAPVLIPSLQLGNLAATSACGSIIVGKATLTAPQPSWQQDR